MYTTLLQYNLAAAKKERKKKCVQLYDKWDLIAVSEFQSAAACRQKISFEYKKNSVLFSNSESTDVFPLCKRTVSRETKVQMCTYVKSNLQ